MDKIAFAAGDNPLLGNDRKIRVPKLPSASEETIESNTEFRYRLQGLAREILGSQDHRIDGCLRRLAPGQQFVEIRCNPDSHTSHYRNLELCNRVWTCPVCSARISSERRKELTMAIAGAKRKNLYMVMVTYTLSHRLGDPLADVLKGLLDSLRLFKAGRAYQEIKAEYGIVGGIRALEMTFGENGWHPHVHELLFIDAPLSAAQVGGMKKWFADRWIDCLNKLGFDASFAHGLNIETANSRIADYIAKWGHEPREREFGVESEITGAANKRASRDGLTPFQLLEAYDLGDMTARALFEEYATVMQGRRQLVWSAGLRALLKLPDETPDELLPGFEEENNTYTIMQIDPDEWKKIYRREIRGALLFLAAAADATSIRALLKKCGIAATYYERPRVEESPPAQPVSVSARTSQLEMFAAGEVKSKIVYS